MKDIMVDEFQNSVQELLVRNKSIVDCMSKFQDSNAEVNRAISKAVTQCGCIRINAKKQVIPKEGDYDTYKKAMETHLEGELCGDCRDSVEKELGSNLFYLTSLCNILNLNLYDILIKEEERARLLGNFSLK